MTRANIERGVEGDFHFSSRGGGHTDTHGSPCSELQREGVFNENVMTQ